MFGTGSGIFVSTIILVFFEVGKVSAYFFLFAKSWFKSIGVDLFVAYVILLMVSTR